MSDTWLLLVALFLVLAAAAAYYALSTSGGPAAGNVSGTARGASGCGGSGGGGDVCVPEAGMYLVILGTGGCPHCRAMKDYLPRVYPDVYFCEIMRRGSVCAEAFMKLFTAGVTSGVPTIVACSNTTGRVVFVEVGEYRNTTWWRSVLLHPPARPMVYEEGKPKTQLDPVTEQELAAMLCRAPPPGAERLHG